MKILVCGGRYYDDQARVKRVLDEHYATDLEIITGGASGADSLAAMWASLRKVKLTIYKADWKAHGKAAGPIRNERMLKEGKPDLVIAFPGFRGTRHMITIAQRAGVNTIQV